MKNQDKITYIQPLVHYYRQFDLGTTGKNIKLGAKTLTFNQFSDRFKKEETAIMDFAGRKAYIECIEAFQEDGKFKEKEAIDKIANFTYSYCLNKMNDSKKKKIDPTTDSKIRNRKYDWTFHIPIMDIGTAQTLMYNTKTQRIDHKSNAKAWEKWVRLQSKEIKELKLQSLAPGVVNYNPYKELEVYYKAMDGQDEEVIHVNAHRIPDWRREDLENPVLPKEFKELMNHLLPNEECRNYVLHWIYFALTSRNETYLFLHGDQGIGKNTLSLILEKLVGHENYNVVSPDFFDDKFTGDLDFKRIVFFDECVVSFKENLSKIKGMTNKKLGIQYKGADSIYKENHCSFIIANNRDRINYISVEDRRYSVPILTENTIASTLGMDWLDRFYELIESEDFIKNIGHWILKKAYKGDYNSNTPYLTSAFYDMAEKCMTEWQRVIIDMIEQKEFEEIDIESIKEQIKHTGRAKVATFLNKHKDRNGKSYGYLAQKAGGKRVIIPSEYYTPDQKYFEDPVEIEGNPDIEESTFEGGW